MHAFCQPKRHPAQIFVPKSGHQNISGPQKAQFANFKPPKGLRTNLSLIYLSSTLPPPPISPALYVFPLLAG